MIPGTTTKLSEAHVAVAATISPKTDIVILTGTGTINTIIPNFGGGVGNGIVFLIPITDNVILGTTGNIIIGATITVNRVIALIYIKRYNLWYIGTALPA